MAWLTITGGLYAAVVLAAFMVQLVRGKIGISTVKGWRL